LRDTERAPTPADKTDYEARFFQEIRGRDSVPILIVQFEFWRPRTDRKDVCGKLMGLQFCDYPCVDRLRLRRNVLLDEAFAFGEDFPQRTCFSADISFLE